MKSLKQKFGAVVFCVVLICISVVAANAQTARPTPDVLRGIKYALESASAPALSAQQEEQLKTLVQQAREARKSQPSGEALGAARKAYHEAILAGDAAAAAAQAQTIANLTAAHTSENLKAEATLAIQALAVLKSNPQQYDALVQKFGSTGVTRLVSGLAGGGFGRGFRALPRAGKGDGTDGIRSKPDRFGFRRPMRRI